MLFRGHDGVLWESLKLEEAFVGAAGVYAALVSGTNTTILQRRHGSARACNTARGKTTRLSRARDVHLTDAKKDEEKDEICRGIFMQHKWKLESYSQRVILECLMILDRQD